jgi:hypothetical protein
VINAFTAIEQNMIYYRLGYEHVVNKLLEGNQDVLEKIMKQIKTIQENIISIKNSSSLAGKEE